MYRSSLLSLLTIALLGVVAVTMPLNSRAATLNDNDYVRIGVPDLPQAVSFFQDVLGCQLVGPISTASSTLKDMSESRLLACESGSIVELFDNHAAASPSPLRRATQSGNESVQFISGNVANADQWLRRAGVRVVGSPQKLGSGPLVGMTVVNFISPWGLQMQLVGWDTNVATTGR